MNGGNDMPDQTLDGSATIRVGAPIFTIVIEFTVGPEDQLRLLEHIDRFGQDVVRYLPGFISASLHRSIDGTRVINYAQWESKEAWQAFMNNPAVPAFDKALRAIATPEPNTYEVSSVHRAEVDFCSLEATCGVAQPARGGVEASRPGGWGPPVTERAFRRKPSCGKVSLLTQTPPTGGPPPMLPHRDASGSDAAGPTLPKVGREISFTCLLPRPGGDSSSSSPAASPPPAGCCSSS